MTIGFDVSQTGRSKAGCGYFADGLIRQLAEVDRENRYVLYPAVGDMFWDADCAKSTFSSGRPNFRRTRAPASFESSQAFWRYPQADFEQQLGSPDIYHANNFFCPELKTARLVYTLYDLGYLEEPAWTTEEEDHALMRYTLMEAALVAAPRNICIGLEPHQQYSKTPAGLDRIFKLVKNPAIGINFDTGNSYLSGQDPYRWLERVAGRLVHLHAKDISVEQSGAERGKVTGTPVGCACGDGVIDWARVIKICRKAKRDIVLSVECGTIDQAERSIQHLKKLL